MDNQCVIAECSTESKTQLALEVLAKAGFAADDVTLIRSSEQFRESGVVSGEALRPHVTPDDSAVPTSTMLGGAIGATAGAATLLGPLLVVGPLAGVALGAAAGGLINLVGGRGVNESDVTAYEAASDQGHVLIIVTASETRLNRAERVLRTIAPHSMRRFHNESEKGAGGDLN